MFHQFDDGVVAVSLELRVCEFGLMSRLTKPEGLLMPEPFRSNTLYEPLNLEIAFVKSVSHESEQAEQQPKSKRTFARGERAVPARTNQHFNSGNLNYRWDSVN